MGAVSSTLLVKVKFHIERGIAVVRGSQQVARKCLVATVDKKKGQIEKKGGAEEAPS